jgi:GPH family glycoside/pentoside/hexuronide:cation symporter
LLPAVSSLLVAWIMRYYPLHRQQVAQVSADLAAREAAVKV